MPSMGTLGSRLLDKLGQGLNTAGSYIRYGVSPEEKYRMVLAQPEYQSPSRESDKTEAERRVSSGLAAQRWGPVLPFLFNAARETSQGVGALAAGKPFYTPGGLESNDPTPGDEDPTSGFNARSIMTGLEASMPGSPTLTTLAALLRQSPQTTPSQAATLRR